MKFFILAIGLMFFSMNVAMASTWYALDASTSTCILAPTTPAQMEAGLRSEGSVPFVKVTELKTGRMVEMTGHIGQNDTGQKLTLFFFTSETACDSLLDMMKTDGLIPDYNQMK